ncbi:MAG: PHP domain-containing protein [Thermodesulfobacteria bacterium]|nr:PHP domain-containing protein [Thermodesulfobacteriota bacterium]
MPMRLDLHLHTDISPCGEQRPEEAVARAREVGLDLICITDHFSTEVLEHLSPGPQENGLMVLVGMEYSTPDGDFLLFAPGKVPWFPRGLSSREVLEEIRRLGGLSIWAHPYRWGREPDEELLEDGLVDAIEVLNGRTSLLANAQARELAYAFDLPGVAGSDAHSVEEIGIVFNETDRLIRTVEDLIAAVKDGSVKPRLSEQLSRLYEMQLGMKYEPF